MSSQQSNHHQQQQQQQQQQEDHLTLKGYHNPILPYSYGSYKTVSDHFPTINRKKINETLLKSDIYTKHRQYRKPRQYLPIYVHEIREQFQLDIIYMDGHRRYNDGFKFLLSIIGMLYHYIFLPMFSPIILFLFVFNSSSSSYRCMEQICLGDSDEKNFVCHCCQSFERTVLNTGKYSTKNIYRSWCR